MPIKNCKRLSYRNVVLSSLLMILIITLLITLTAWTINSTSLTDPVKILLIGTSSLAYSVATLFATIKSGIHYSVNYKNAKKEYFVNKKEYLAKAETE
ncbi:MAG: hypothetical protein FWC33_02825 [Candidatus Bathyarchaeota archaeon]|nr:hypothetical protein [Candidatus Termiticorpusculum sp.]